jgi:hypothetical protein
VRRFLLLQDLQASTDNTNQYGSAAKRLPNGLPKVVFDVRACFWSRILNAN